MSLCNSIDFRGCFNLRANNNGNNKAKLFGRQRLASALGGSKLSRLLWEWRRCFRSSGGQLDGPRQAKVAQAARQAGRQRTQFNYWPTSISWPAEQRSRYSRARKQTTEIRCSRWLSWWWPSLSSSSECHFGGRCRCSLERT